FARYLPIACHLEDGSRFDEVLSQVSQAVREGSKWQEAFSWEDLRAQGVEGPPQRFLAYCFDFDRAPDKYLAADLWFSVIKQHVCSDRFKVKLSCLERADSLLLEFHYDSLMVSTDLLERLAGEFISLINHLGDKPGAELGELDILDE